MFKLCRKQKSPRKKDKKDHTKFFFLFLFFRNARVVSRVIWKFHPVLTISIFNFFSPSNNSTNWRQPCRAAQPYWAPDKSEHVAEKIDIVAFKTAEISRREKKLKQSGGKYICPNHEIMTF